jgi:hypothetical protein
MAFTEAVRLRVPSGKAVDSASESWWGESWANGAVRLLGPEWMAGRNTREE